MSKRYWLCNTTYDNWQRCWDDLSWGVPELKDGTSAVYGLNQLTAVRKGDGLLFYVQKLGVAGYFLANSELYQDTRTIWIDRKYPYRIRLAEERISLLAVPFSAMRGKIRNNDTMKLITNGASLLGKSMIPISSSDAEYLINLMGTVGAKTL